MLVLLGALACGPSRLELEASKYVGEWLDEGGAVTTIEVQEREPVITSIVDYDGEVFVMESTVWQGGALVWSYNVPSSETYVVIAATSIEGDQLCTTWSNANDSGTECYTRR